MPLLTTHRQLMTDSWNRPLPWTCRAAASLFLQNWWPLHQDRRHSAPRHAEDHLSTCFRCCRMSFLAFSQSVACIYPSTSDAACGIRLTSHLAACSTNFVLSGVPAFSGPLEAHWRDGATPSLSLSIRQVRPASDVTDVNKSTLDWTFLLYLVCVVVRTIFQ